MPLPLRSGFALGTVIAILRVLEDRHGTDASFFGSVGNDDLVTVVVGEGRERQRHEYSLHALFHAGEWLLFCELDPR